MQPNIDEIKKIIQSAISQEQLELVDLIYRFENGRDMLRLLVDRPGGVTLGECIKINKMVREVLYQSNLIVRQFVLEVNSPGLDRPIVTKRDFERNINKKIRLIAKNDKGTTDIVIGSIKYAGEDKIILDVEGRDSEFLFGNIIKARLEIS